MSLPAHFPAIGTRTTATGRPLERMSTPIPAPGRDEVLIEVRATSLNPLERKLADINFLHRKLPSPLGFDAAGVIVATGSAVRGFAVGDEVMAMLDPTLGGCWADGSVGYAVAQPWLVAHKPAAMTFEQAGMLPIAFLAAWEGLDRQVIAGDTVFIPGGGGGVGHLAVQLATWTFGARVITTAGRDASARLARESGATEVLDYRAGDVTARVLELTGGHGVDVAFDATYNEDSFVQSARTVRPGGKWVVLGVGPGKTTRVSETESPVDGILSAKGAAHINANVLRYFTEPAMSAPGVRQHLTEGLNQAARLFEDGRLRPHASLTVPGTLGAINDSLDLLTSGGAIAGKVAVTLGSTRG